MKKNPLLQLVTMATNKEVVINQENFQCSLCLEVYSKPRTLPCLHSFCHDCLLKYLEGFSGQNTYKCPMCLKDFEVDPTVSENVVKWMEQKFPVNFTLALISDQCREQNNARGLMRLCEPCLNDSAEATAVAYCLDCREQLCKLCRTCHKRSKATKSHTVIDIDRREENASKDVDFLMNIAECPSHIGQEVWFVCKCHDKVCCHICAISEHKQCDLVLLRDVVRESESDTDMMVESLITKTCYLSKHAEALIAHTKKQPDLLADVEHQVTECLKEFKELSESSFLKLRDCTLRDTARKKLDLEKRTRAKLQELTDFKSEIVTAKSQLDIVCKYGQSKDRYLIKRKVQYIIEDAEMRIKTEKLRALELKRLNIRKIAETKTGNVSAEKIEVVEVNACFPHPGLPFALRQTKLLAKYHLCGGYKGRFNAKTFTWFGDYIIVAIEGPNTLFCIDTSNNTMKSTYQCTSVPTSVGEMGDKLLYVCLPDENTLLLVRVDAGRLSEFKRLEICPTFSNLIKDVNIEISVIYAPDKGLISVCDLEGNAKLSIDLTSVCCDNAVRNVHYLGLDSVTERIYISCFETHQLLATTLNGHTIFKYKHRNLKFPCSPSVDSEGNIYVPSTGYKSHCLHQVGPGGKLIREILNGELLLPWCVKFHRSMNKLAVTDNSTDGQLKIYEFV